MKYKMEIVMSYWQTVVIEADSRADAENRALYEFDITKARMGDGEVYDTQLVYEPTPEEDAFLASYCRNVAQASDTEVRYFLEHRKDGLVFKDQFYWWAGVEDAWLMWQDAKKFIQEEDAKKFTQGESK